MNFLKPILPLVFVCFFISTTAAVYAGTGKTSTTRLEWTELDGIIRYDVEIRDEKDKTVFKQSVEKAFVEFSLPPGEYKINIISINLFGKVSTESGWKSFLLRKKEEPVKKPKKKWKPLYVEDLLGIGLRISAGYSYSMPIGSWSDYFNNSYISALFRVSLTFGNLGKLKKYRFFKHIGLEIDAGYTQYDSKSNEGFIPFDGKLIPAGLNLIFTTGSRIPVNLFVRGGGGMVFSNFEYRPPGASPVSLWSSDPYILGGLSLELTFYKYLFIEIGADFFYILYLDDPYMGLRYFCSIGIRL